MPVSKTSTPKRKASDSSPATKTATKAASKATGKAPVKAVTKAASKTVTKTPTATAATKTAAKKAPAKKTAVAKSTPAASPAKGGDKVTLRGRSVFIVQTTSAGVTVRTAWLSEDKTLRDMVAVFPDVNYAVTLIDDLKRQVLKHFSQAAQIGAKAIANQRATKAK